MPSGFKLSIAPLVASGPAGSHGVPAAAWLLLHAAVAATTMSANTSLGAKASEAYRRDARGQGNGIEGTTVSSEKYPVRPPCPHPRCSRAGGSPSEALPAWP